MFSQKDTYFTSFWVALISMFIHSSVHRPNVASPTKTRHQLQNNSNSFLAISYTLLRLEEALALIAQGAITSVAATSPAASIAARKVALATGKAQSAIRYLAFLAEGSKLFDAALGECDFDLARAVARQCQMDPKAYIPLLEEFAAIGRREGSTDGMTAACCLFPACFPSVSCLFSACFPPVSRLFSVYFPSVSRLLLDIC